MSAINPSAPLDTATVASIDDAMREERVWMLAFWTAFIVRQSDGVTPNDPSTSIGALKLPFAAPGTLRVGDMYGSTDGLFYGVVTGPTAKLMGTVEHSKRCGFRQATAPTGWTRESGFTNGAIPRYVAVATPIAGVGGTQAISTAMTHTGSSTNGIGGTTTALSIQSGTLATHALKYLDVILADKDN